MSSLVDAVSGAVAKILDDELGKILEQMGQLRAANLVQATEIRELYRRCDRAERQVAELRGHLVQMQKDRDPRPVLGDFDQVEEEDHDGDQARAQV